MPIATEGLARVTNTAPDRAAIGATINAWRYGLAALVLALAILPSWRRTTRSEITDGAILGAFLGCGMFLQILGLAWVVPSVSGMITATPVILAPLAQAVFLRRPVGGRLWTTACIAAGGCAVLTWGGGSAHTAGSLLSVPPFPGAGEIVTLGAAFCFTGLILTIDRCGNRGHNVSRMSSVMFLTVAGINGAVALGSGGLALHSGATFSVLGTESNWLMAMVTLALVCTIGAFWLMNRAQPALSPARAAVLYTLEPVFALLLSLVMGQEQLTLWTVAGGALILMATLFATADATPSIDCSSAQEMKDCDHASYRADTPLAPLEPLAVARPGGTDGP